MQTREDAVYRKVFDKYLDGNTPQQIALDLGLSFNETKTILRDRSLVSKKVISPSLYNSVQIEIKKRSSLPNKKYPLVGLLFCGHCGAPMLGRKRKYKEKIYHQYICKTYNDKGREACPQKNLDGKELESLVFNDLKRASTLIYNKLKDSGYDESIRILSKELEYLKNQIEKMNEKTLQVFMNQDNMTNTQFDFVMSQLKEQVEELEAKSRMTEKKLNELSTNKEYELKPMIEALLSSKDNEELGKFFHFFIDSIYVKDSELTINYKFDQP